MAAARAALERFYGWADGVQVPELSRLAGTVRAWEAEILAFHATDGCSNGLTEAVNLLIRRSSGSGTAFRKVMASLRKLAIGTLRPAKPVNCARRR